MAVYLLSTHYYFQGTWPVAQLTTQHFGLVIQYTTKLAMCFPKLPVCSLLMVIKHFTWTGVI